MPIIAEQHRWKDKDHTPLEDWPEDCYVQWGGGGVVISQKPEGSYRTAFFEAFPKDGGFIRGEGPTIAEAERKALEKYLKESVCEHLWSRKGYTNGGAICRRCGGFQTVFHPIVKLGAFREPLEAMALDMVAEGYMRPDPDDPKHNTYRRRSWLKARRMGIDLPDFYSAPPSPPGFERDDYAKASRHAVVAFLKKNLELLDQGEKNGIDGLFSALHISSLRRMVEEDEDDEPQP